MSLKQIYTQQFPPKARWAVDDIPDLTGKVMIVTGSNTGIGKETVKALLQHGAKVYMAARNPSKAEEAIKELKEQTGKEAYFLKLDLADLKSVKAAADEYLSKESSLHDLFNNGGVMFPPTELITKDGYDLQFGTNVIGHFYFTQLLLPLLIATATRSMDGKARVVNNYGSLKFDTFKDGPARQKMSSWNLYTQSKFANVVFATELARRFGEQGIVSTSLHPGNLRTDLQRHVSKFERCVTDWMLHDAPAGALTQLWAGTSPEGADLNGKFLIPWARIGEAKKETQDPELGRQLWDWLEAECKDI